MFVLKFSLPTGNPSSRQYLPIALRVTVRVTLPCFRQRLRDWYIFYVARQQKPIHVLLWGEGYCVLFFFTGASIWCSIPRVSILLISFYYYFSDTELFIEPKTSFQINDTFMKIKYDFIQIKKINCSMDGFLSSK